MPVQVIIADSDPHTRLLHAIVAQGRTSQYSFFAKSPIMIVHEQQTGGGIAGDIDILPSVFIKIRRRDCHAVAGWRLRDAGFLTYIGERSVSVISIERMGAGLQ